MTLPGLPGAVHIGAEPGDVSTQAAEWLSQVTVGADRFRVALSGGSTPRLLFKDLASPRFRERVDWTRWEVFFADERAVPPSHPESNYRLIHDTLLTAVPIAATRVHRVPAELPDLDAVAADYSALLAECCGLPPRLDVVLLGLGSNGHTASLFPGTEALTVTGAWATRGRADYEPRDRITLTYPAINAAARVAFLVTGAGKAEALRGVLDGSVPAAGVNPDGGELHWFLDAAAAQSIS